MNNNPNFDDIDCIKFRFPSVIGDQFVEYFPDGRRTVTDTSPSWLHKQVDIVIETGVRAYIKFKRDGLYTDSFRISGDRFSFKLSGQFYFGMVAGSEFCFYSDKWDVLVYLDTM